VKRAAFLLIGLAALAAWLGPWLDTPIAVARLAFREPPRTLVVPVARVGREALRDTWGAARDGGRAHQGIDIFAPRGTAVVAATDGVVWSTRGNRLGGTVAWVFGPGRQLHYYAHLDTVSVRPGMRLRAGDAIGTVGTTGNARGTPPHLHYGVYTARGAINPYPLLRADEGSATSDATGHTACRLAFERCPRRRDAAATSSNDATSAARNASRSGIAVPSASSPT
jgi:murein DD-endopeptidase MepM/ murein hydrolase activator NlpD